MESDSRMATFGIRRIEFVPNESADPSARTRKYRKSGTLPWQFNEPFPMAACTSAVDYYYGQPKPLCYAVTRAYESVHITAQFATQSWANRDTFEAQVRVINDFKDPL